MNRAVSFCFCLLCCFSFNLQAETGPYPSGFVESFSTDPTSGLPVHVVTWQKPGAPWLLLIHGLGANASQDWLPLLPSLAEHYQLLLFDLPGFGGSAMPEDFLTPKKYADLVHLLVKEHAKTPVFVVGHSLGGAVALRYSHDYPEDVQRLLLIDVAGVLQTSVFTRHLSQVPKSGEQIPLLNTWLNRGGRVLNHFSGKAQDWLAEYATSFQTLASSNTARGLLYKDHTTINAALGLVNEDFTPLISEIKTPVWMLWGEDDPVAPLRTGQALQWLLPMAQLEILSKVGHVPMSEATDKTSAWMLNALQMDVPRLQERVIGASQGAGYCKNQKNLRFTGVWTSLHLEHCANIRIENAHLGSLVVKNSSANLINVQLHATTLALEAKNANIMATGLRVDAPLALQVEDSRLDFAAFSINAPLLGEQKDESQYFFSLGHWCDGQSGWWLHDVWKPKNGRLDKQLQRVRGGACAFETAQQ